MESSFRIVVVGDSGVGKTTFLRGICQKGGGGERSSPPRSTVGYAVHTFVSAPPFHPVNLHFLDICGSLKFHRAARYPCYEVASAFVFVADQSEPSVQSLWAWHEEVSTYMRSQRDEESGFGAMRKVPLLIVQLDHGIDALARVAALSPAKRAIGKIVSLGHTLVVAMLHTLLWLPKQPHAINMSGQDVLLKLQKDFGAIIVAPDSLSETLLRVLTC